uniref:Uncharacterized protein n=1 Tax=Anguilla anguilla TaxID=7936 RepID=A0A0E9UZM6_ANGAN
MFDVPVLQLPYWQGIATISKFVYMYDFGLVCFVKLLSKMVQ